jgi:aerobic-type carbon monoxide dehydrogenase small subunit (CoxS/CutS family)
MDTARATTTRRGASGASMRVRCGFCFIAFDGSTVRAIGMRLGWMIDADCRCEK